MNAAVRNLLSFLLIISSTASIVHLVLQGSPCPCRSNSPADKEEMAMANGTQADHHDGPRMNKHGVVNPTATTSSANNGDAELRELLRRAAMEDNKTIIMAFTNEAWTAPGSLTDLFLESFRIGLKTAPLLQHLVLVAIDASAFQRCRRVHQHCHALAVDGANFTAEQRYMAGNYLDMVWRRIRFQARVLELGYNFLLTDVDIVWFRNPLLRVPIAADIAMSCDWFHGANPYDLNKGANSGLVYARANERTAAFYANWHEARHFFPGKKTQDVFDRLKHALAAIHAVTVQFVDTAYLGTFCDRQRRKDFNKLCTFHANCIIGLENKVQRLRGVLDEWKQFRASNGANVTD